MAASSCHQPDDLGCWRVADGHQEGRGRLREDEVGGRGAVDKVGDGAQKIFETTRTVDVVPNVVTFKKAGDGMQEIFATMRTDDVVPKVVKFNKVGDGMQEIFEATRTG